MKITIVNRHREDTLGGSELQCDFIATELTRRGYDVTYVVPGGEKEKYHTTYNVITCMQNSVEIEASIVKTNPDIVYWRFNKNFFFDTVRKLKKHPCKFTFSASSAYDVNWFLYKKSVPFRKNIPRFFKSIKEQMGMRYVDAVIVNNESHLNKLPVKHQTFIPNGMTDEVEEFSWDKPYCAWIANIKKIKRPELFIDLSKVMKGIGIDCLMVGDIQERGYLWINNRENLPSNLHYLGQKSLKEVNGILKNSMIHVHTCLAEGFPNVFIQAWLQSVPSVSFGFDPSNYIKNNNLGFTADENWDLFVEQIMQLINNPEKRNKLGSNANTFALEMFQIEKSVTKLENVFSQLLNHNTSRKV
ncbi:MAG: glycosyltransferase family 4 protein [Balneolaceae bacterium]|nr:glycosyltransferase family 4 protein [Balneolaceae bacterium]